MMEVMSLPRRRVEISVFHNTCYQIACYQIVAVPQDLKVWVRLPEDSDRTKVNLKLLFC